MKKILMTFAAIFCCVMTTAVFTACTDNTDNSVSVVDDKQFNVDETHMDKSVRPGDDFFMYCNGGYWNNTVVDEETPFKTLLINQAKEWSKDCEARLLLPSKAKLLADADKTDEATIAAQKAKLQSAIDRVNALTTKEEAWKLIAELMLEGYRTPFEPTIFSYSGKVAMVLIPNEDATDYASLQFVKKDPSWRLANDPGVLACVRPLKGAATRSFDNEQWPMLVTMFQTLGVSLDDAYTMETFPSFAQMGMGEMLAEEFQAIQDMSVEEWKTELIAKLTEDAVFFDDAAFEAANAEADEPLSREEMLENIATKYLKYELSHEFANAYITAEMKQRTREYSEVLIQTFRERIQQNQWMSEASKQNALEKLNAMVLNIGAPDTWFDEGLADLSQEQTLYDDIRGLRRALFNLQRKLTGMTTKDVCFHLTILFTGLSTVNAFYVPNTNSMNIYPAWMVAPFYDPQQNDAHNYATIAVFGHEITHGFDNNGACYNKIGDLEDIWATDADRQEFQNRAQQLMDYYSTLEVMPKETGLCNDGEYTAGENIADLGGFFLAYDSYVKHLKAEGFKDEQLRIQQQRFYEAFAYLWSGKWTADYALSRTGDEARPDKKDEHSLFRERVNGVVSNTDDWYDLFGVKAGDKFYLAPENRVRIW